MPMTPVIGVRISWLIIARNPDLAGSRRPPFRRASISLASGFLALVRSTNCTSRCCLSCMRAGKIRHCTRCPCRLGEARADFNLLPAARRQAPFAGLRQCRTLAAFGATEILRQQRLPRQTCQVAERLVDHDTVAGRSVDAHRHREERRMASLNSSISARLCRSMVQRGRAFLDPAGQRHALGGQVPRQALRCQASLASSSRKPASDRHCRHDADDGARYWSQASGGRKRMVASGIRLAS